MNRRVLVGLAADRMRWWCNPPYHLRPTPALAGWTLAEWRERAQIGTPGAADAEDRAAEVFAGRWPAPLATAPYDPDAIVTDAIRVLIQHGEADTAGEGRWRAVARAKTSV